MPTLTNLTTLSSLLPLTTLTALLLTAEWSVDTTAARTSLTDAQALTPCPSIQFLEFSITPAFLHQDEQGQARDHRPFLYNITTNPPYVPHLRIITLKDDDNFTVTPYEDSFDPLPLARFLASLCAQPFPETSSRDSLSAALRDGKKGAIIIDKQPFTAPWKLVYDILSTRPDWVIGFADSGKEHVFRERHSADPPAVVLVDRLRDAYHTVSLHGAGRDALIAAVEAFEAGMEESSAVVTKRVLAYFTEPRVWRMYIENSTPMGLDAWMGIDNTRREGSDEESVLWVLVTAPWCAFCQRSIPEFERFQSIVRRVPGVHAVIVDDTDTLPRFLDRLVDGFPTILLLRERGPWIGVQEYLGERSVGALVDVHAGNVERVMRQLVEDGDL